MSGLTCALIRKDMRIIAHGPGSLCQAMLLGLLLIFLFGLSRDIGQITTPREAATIFWLGSVFCQILIFGALYGIEETNLARQALLLAPSPCQAIWLGKAVTGLVLLLACQLMLVPATIVFLNQFPAGPMWPGLAGLAAVDMGMAILGSLLGALGQGQSGKDALLSILFFPLLAPILMAGLNLGAITLGAEDGGSMFAWLGLALAFDAIFSASALLMFGFLFRGED